MADRTPSMSDANRGLMKTAIVDSLKTMTPSLHYVAFGALHKSRTGTSCATDTDTYDGEVDGRRHRGDGPQSGSATTTVILERPR